MNNLVYFLVYRKRVGQKLRLKHPTGGLVMRTEVMLHGLPVADFQLAKEVANERYHCDDGENLTIAEVFLRKDRKLAKRLHQQWEDEEVEFFELMGAN